METIALFGGSFDPPHIGHKAVIEALLKLDYIEKVVVTPTFLNPFKGKSHAPSNLRLKWLKEIFSSYENVIINDYEVMQGKKIPTINTVNHLLKRYKKIYVVIGADNLGSLHSWDNFSELNKKVTFIIAKRDNLEVPSYYTTIDIDENISSTSLRHNLNVTKLTKTCANEIARYYKENNAK